MITEEGPRPVVVFAILLGCIILFGMVFAAIKVFLLEPHITREQGTVTAIFCQTDDCAAAFIEEVNKSLGGVCAFYDLSDTQIRKALIRQNISVAVFEENFDRTATDIPVPSIGLMHHKFCVLQQAERELLITGSANPTPTDMRTNDNNILFIESPTLAKRYRAEFDELVNRRSITYRKNKASPALIILNNLQIEQRFCPQEACEDAVLRRIEGARQSVRFMTFSFTSDPIGDALIAAKERGVAVEGVTEAKQLSEFSEKARLDAYNITTLIDGNRNTMHHKVFIIDNATVITGSYNPTAGGNERNDENLLIIDDPRIAKEYINEYARVKSVALAES